MALWFIAPGVEKTSFAQYLALKKAIKRQKKQALS